MSVDQIDAEMATGAYPCPFVNCDFETYSKDRLMDHCTDDCDLWEKVFNGEVVVVD